MYIYIHTYIYIYNIIYIIWNPESCPESGKRNLETGIQSGPALAGQHVLLWRIILMGRLLASLA